MKTQTFIDALDILTRNLEIRLVDLFATISSQKSREEKREKLLLLQQKVEAIGIKYLSLLQIGESMLYIKKEMISQVSRLLAEIQFFTKRLEQEKLTEASDTLCLKIAEIQRYSQDVLRLSPTQRLSTIQHLKEKRK